MEGMHAATSFSEPSGRPTPLHHEEGTVAASCLDKKKTTKITFNVELVQIQHTIVPNYNTDCSVYVLLSVCMSES